MKPYCLLVALFFSLTRLASLDAAEPKVYALFVFDTDLVGYANGEESEEATRILRAGALRNRDMMMAAFVQSFNIEGRRHRLEYKILDGRRATWKNILNYWDTIDSNEEDTFVFYYFGHGAVDSELGHYLALTHAAEENGFGGAPCYRCYIRAAMQAKPNRLCVLLTDCCSSFVDTDGGLTRVAEGANWDVMKHLMFGPAGLVDVTAAEHGTEAQATNGGGFFTESLVHHFCGPLEDAEVDVDGALSWSEFLGSVRHRVKEVHRVPQSQKVYFLNKWGTVRRERELVVNNRSQHAINLFVQYHAYHSDLNAWDWYGSSFYATGQPVEASKSWMVAPETKTRLLDGGEYRIRGRQFNYSARSVDGSLVWPQRQRIPIYGENGYISDDDEIGTATVTFD
ncbi:MAG: hypothetical protein ACK58L_14675 [Planctomycetota bacterium]